jgi:hypothetical protein
MMIPASNMVLTVMPYDPTPREQKKEVVDQPRKRRKGPWLMLVFSILGLIIIVASLILPWYVIDDKESPPESRAEFGLSGLTVHVETQNGTDSEYYDYTDEIFCEEEHTVGVFNVTLGLAILLLILDAVVIVLFVFVLLRMITLKILGIMGIVVIIISMLVPFYIFGTMPGALTADATKDEIQHFDGISPFNSFAGRDDKRDVSWGPGAGWYMPFMNMVFLLLGTFFLVRKPKEKEQMPITKVPQPGSEDYDQAVQSQKLKFCSACNTSVTAEGNICPICGRYLR